MAKNRITLFIAGLFVVGAMLTTISCKKDQTQPLTPEACPDTISFSTTVEPLIQQNCSTSGCHDASAAGGYDLVGHANIAANASVINDVMNHNAGVTAMPFGGNKLADSLLQQYDCWVQQGALDN